MKAHTLWLILSELNTTQRLWFSTHCHTFRTHLYWLETIWGWIHTNLNHGPWWGPVTQSHSFRSSPFCFATSLAASKHSRKVSRKGHVTNQLVILFYLLRDICTWARTSEKSHVYLKKTIPSGLEFQTRFDLSYGNYFTADGNMDGEKVSRGHNGLTKCLKFVLLNKYFLLKMCMSFRSVILICLMGKHDCTSHSPMDFLKNM